MKNLKKSLLVMLLGVAILSFNACSLGKNDKVLSVSLENPISIDKEAKTVTVLAQVNGKYFNEATRHASVFIDGANGSKSIFTAYANAEDFYNAMIEIGGEPGNNMTLDNKEITFVAGSPVDFKVYWEGAKRAYDINEVIIDSNKNNIDLRFGGNLETAKSKNTGCLACLDSCPVGIVSNATYTYGSVEARDEVRFTANKEVLPDDGTYVAITYSLKNKE